MLNRMDQAHSQNKVESVAEAEWTDKSDTVDSMILWIRTMEGAGR